MKSGEHITFSYDGQELEGLVIQVKNGEANIKLDSGYNIVVPEEQLENVRPHKGKKTGKKKAEKLKQDSSLPKVTILHTGGTIASKVDYETGGVSTNFSNEEFLALFPELQSIAYVNSQFLRNMWSQDIRFAHYNIIARAVEKEAKNGAAGVVVTHGTDFLAVTAAALSFALEGLPIPVLLVGSQRSSDRGSSDAGSNLIGAVNFICQTQQPGVFVAAHENSSDDSIAILDGLHCRKMHSSSRYAFVSVNAPLFGRVENGDAEILDTNRAEEWKQQAGKLKVMPFKEDAKIGLWKTHPQSFVDELAVYKSYDALVIEGSGMGHGPTTKIDEFTEEHEKIRDKIGELAKKIPVAMTVQTVFGRVNINVYKPQRELLERGVLGNYLDMHPEVAWVKLGWLVSNCKKKEIAEKYHENLRGEINPISRAEAKHPLTK